MEHIFCHVAQRLRPVSIKKNRRRLSNSTPAQRDVHGLSVIHHVRVECMHHGFEVRGISGHRLKSVWGYTLPLADKCARLIDAFV
jgi:hypothetical protein